MLSSEILREAKKRFAIVGPSISESELVALFPDHFDGREDLFKFYLSTNGGSRTPQGCLIHCGNTAHKISRDRLNEIRIEGFFSIALDPEDKMLPFAPMLEHYSVTQKLFGQESELAAFLKRHKPVAFDHSGNDVWIDTETGLMQHMDWDNYEDGPAKIAGSFEEFVSRFWIDPVLPDLD